MPGFSVFRTRARPPPTAGSRRRAGARCTALAGSREIRPPALAEGRDAIAGCVLVTSARPDRPGWLPASLPGVYAVTADDTLAFGVVQARGTRQLLAPARPRDLGFVAREANLWRHLFACARGRVHLARHAARAVAQDAGARPAWRRARTRTTVGCSGMPQLARACRAGSELRRSACGSTAAAVLTGSGVAATAALATARPAAPAPVGLAVPRIARRRALHVDGIHPRRRG